MHHGKVDSTPGDTNAKTEPFTPPPNNDNNPGNTGDNVPRYKGFEYLGYLVIPKTGITYPILRKVTNKSLEVSVALEYTDRGINEPRYFCCNRT